MAIPPLKQKLEAAIVSPVDHMKRKPDDESEEYDSFHAVAEDLITAIKAHDVPGCADALRAAFDLADSDSYEDEPQMEIE